MLVFVRLLQVTHSLFQEVDELKQAIAQIAAGMDIEGGEETLKN